MRRYLEHMHNKDPHERRAHALKVASAVTGLVFMVWIATLGVRLAVPEDTVAQDSSTNSGQAAAVAEAAPKTGPRLEVSTSSVFLPEYSDQ